MFTDLIPQLQNSNKVCLTLFHKYLAWAFVEAAHFAIQFNSRIKSFYQRKKANSKAVVAIKSVAHKLCRACYYVMRDRVDFDVNKAFGQK